MLRMLTEPDSDPTESQVNRLGEPCGRPPEMKAPALTPSEVHLPL